MFLIRRSLSPPSSFLRAPCIISKPSPSNSCSLMWMSSSSSSSSGRIRGIHVFRCPDAVGIVAKISDCIASRGGNIHRVDVFVPEDKRIFYSRSEFTFDPATWARKTMDTDFRNISKLFNADISVFRIPDTDPKFKIAILASKQDHCLVDLLHGWQDGWLPVQIKCVISNHGRASRTHVASFLERDEIPYHRLKTKSESQREDEILKLVQGTDFLVLARYTPVLSGRFLKRYGKDVINIHHGLLPSFKGGDPCIEAYDAGVKLIGATCHFLTERIDEGPIIDQMVETVSHKDSRGMIVQKSKDVEKQCLLRAIKSYCELRVFPGDLKKTVVF